MNNTRETWATKIGLILAMAGNAVGLGNFLRFPVQAAKNGGGAFMIPYFISFLFLGIPLMWVEWTIGRFGGKYNHGSTPGMFDKMWKKPISKYLGLIGVVGPLLIVVYYAYIESWTLSYCFYSLLNLFPKLEGVEGGYVLERFRGFLFSHIGEGKHGFFLIPSVSAYIFYVLTLFLNLWILYRGVSKGIEAFAKVAMPLLFIFAIILAVRTLTLGSPVSPDFSSIKGLNWLWTPDLSSLTNWKVWLAACGQIFFTLSVGMGAIHTYASYLKPKDDIVASGLTTASINEFVEVVLGASIAIPAAVAFFGLENAQEIAKGGAFNLGFVSMPAVINMMPLSFLFGFLWFGLLFFAGITSSIALTQPAIAFLEDELKIPKKKAVIAVGIFIFLSAQLPIFIKGSLDELDFWMGTFFITLFALLECIVFAWIFGMNRAWEEIHQGALFRIPRVFFYIIKFVTPTILILVISGWLLTEWIPLMKSGGLGVWITRIYILLTFIIGFSLVKKAFSQRK